MTNTIDLEDSNRRTTLYTRGGFRISSVAPGKKYII